MWSMGADQGLTTAPVQGIYERSADQIYPLGQKLWYGDRCFKYAKAGATLTSTSLACMNDTQIQGWTACPTETAIGTDEIKTTIGTTEGPAGTGLIAKDSLFGGYVTVFMLNAGGANTDFTFRIVGNTATPATGGVMTLTIDNPLPYACTTSAYIEITGNPYEDVRCLTSGVHHGRAKLGLPLSVADTTYPYCWLQTWGPTWISPQTTAPYGVGYGPNRVQVVAREDGSIQNHMVYTAAATASTGELDTGVHQQHVGFVFTRVNGGAESQGTPLVFLQISC